MAHHKPRDAKSRPLDELRSIAIAAIENSTPAQRALAFGFIPALLLLIGTLPLSLQHQWVLQLDEPTWIELYLSNFVHRDISHLSENIIGYLIVMAMIFPLAVSAGEGRTLAALSLVLLSVVPFLVSGYSIVALEGTTAETTAGFSGIVAAYAGTLPYFIVQYTDERIADLHIGNTAAGLMAIELGGVLVLAGVRGWMVALLAVGGFVVLGASLRDRCVVTQQGREYERHLLVYALSIFVAVPVTLLVTVEAGTNVYGHLGGLAAGFLLPIVVIQCRSLMQTRR